ncbi:MAG: Coenzyme biosynthesis bifunctional protein CoaBC [Pseudomonadota bacterium]
MQSTREMENEIIKVSRSATLPNMNDLHGKRIVLGLTGGIACYKAAELCRSLVKVGAKVQVVMTESAAQFITPVTMQALSGQPVFTSQWDAREGNNMAHINKSRCRCHLDCPRQCRFHGQTHPWQGR